MNVIWLSREAQIFNIFHAHPFSKLQLASYWALEDLSFFGQNLKARFTTVCLLDQVVAFDKMWYGFQQVKFDQRGSRSGSNYLVTNSITFSVIFWL